MIHVVIVAEREAVRIAANVLGVVLDRPHCRLAGCPRLKILVGVYPIHVAECELVNTIDERLACRLPERQRRLALTDTLHVFKVLLVLEIAKGVGCNAVGDRLPER